MEKTELPTKADLEELREKGIVPYGSFVTLGAMAIAVIVSLSLMQSTWVEFLAGVTSLDSLAQTDPTAQTARRLLIRLIVVPAVASLVAGLGIGLFQTRFLFRPANLSWELARRDGSDQQGSLLRLLVSAIAGIFIVLAWFFICYRLAGFVGVLLNNGPSYPSAWALSMFRSLLPVLVLILSLITFAAWLGSRAIFTQRHKVPRRFGGARSYEVE